MQSPLFLRALGKLRALGMTAAGGIELYNLSQGMLVVFRGLAGHVAVHIHRRFLTVRNGGHHGFGTGGHIAHCKDLGKAGFKGVRLYADQSPVHLKLQLLAQEG